MIIKTKAKKGRLTRCQWDPDPDPNSVKKFLSPLQLKVA